MTVYSRIRNISKCLIFEEEFDDIGQERKGSK